MSKSKKKRQEAPAPRPEAAPLPLKRLTRAQWNAGKAIAEALQDMANERGPSAPVPAREHSYLPHIEGKRSNRVLLIDGDRGTGKSTLVVTLLHAYGQQVLGEEPPEKFEKMDDRIIPIGLIDLQPLPPQTNLPLHIAGHLKRVVEAVEPPTPVAPENPSLPWEGPALSQLREKWLRLMKLLVTWDESLEGRVGRRDMSAYVIETIDEELERGQLPQRFREALDALVEDYARKYRKKPLFLLAIDDADMNPRLSVKLLELLRKLWHPRLAFLVAGDSKLFLSRLQESLQNQAGKGPKDQEDSRRLAEDIYAKDIPSSARFRLDTLTHRERVKRIREIRKLLKQYTVEVRPPEIPREYPANPPTLRDYLLENEQSAELLPERLRQIDELTARLRKENDVKRKGPPSSASLRIIKWLWDQTVKEWAPQHRELTEMVKSSRMDGRLQLNTQKVRLMSEFEPVAGIPAGSSGSTLSLQDLLRFRAYLVSNIPAPQLGKKLGNQELDGPLTACWLLAADVAADVVQGSRLDELAAPFDKGTLQFVVASWKNSQLNTAVVVPWVLPAWKAPVDHVLFARYWRQLLAQPHGTWDVSLLARQFLWLALQIARSRGVTLPKEAWWEGVSDWPALAEELARLAEPSEGASPRQQVNARWALEEAVLIAAPESGLPLEEARSFLEVLMKRLGPLWSARAIQARRFARMVPPVPPNRATPDRQFALEDIDATIPSHPFVEAMKGLSEQTSSRGDVADLWNSINRLEVPQLKPIMRDEHELSHYSTTSRQRALGNLPKVLASAARLEVERHQRISENARTPVVLVGLWRVFAEKLARPDVMEWFSLYQTKIIISKAASEFGKHLRDLIWNGREGDAREITIDAQRTLHIERFAPVRRAPELPAPLDALFRLIFDYVQDQDDASDLPAEHPELLLWPVVFTQSLSDYKQPFHSWPAVSWPSLKEYEDFVGIWAETVQNLSGWLTLDSATHKPYVADSLALSYLRNCAASRWRSGGSPYIEGVATKMQFDPLLRNLTEQSKAPVGRRDKLFARWVESLPLMGTPEAALSNSIAQVFIEYALSAGMDPSRLRRMRRERMRADGVPHDLLETVLENIDEPFPEHPWVKRIEARGPADGDEPSRKKPHS
ncbi:hypothetical protein JRI60_52705 [Archangium violaceum]|uniref:hypothetical protein n=1 Tax=Archangium violaceum TaxID=83451 RepID=UPI001950AD82|nr:hypothetical protein [Archangium violaceum]QRN97496.1 hypothetical protein JRI60_52705 [Archangium violaceum]